MWRSTMPPRAHRSLHMPTPSSDDVAAARPAAQAAEQERQFREILEYCPAALIVVDEDGRLIFHNASLRELLGYDHQELELVDTKKFWLDLDERRRIIDMLR